jgi:glycyl-tRNA synthetase (class II)
MAEIEHFCDPMEKNHPKFESVRDTEMLLYSAANQMDGKSAELHSIGQAVDKVKQKLAVFHYRLTNKSWGTCIQLLKC